MPTIYKPKRRYNRTGNSYDAERRKIYNSERWRRLRKIKFAADPLCEVCKKEGRITPAEDIHHIRSFMTGATPDQRYALAYDYDNLMSVCKKCHQRIHNEQKLNKS